MKYKILYFAIYFAYIIYAIYLAPYLASLGFQTSQIGFIYVVGGIIIIISQVTTGIVYDQIKHKFLALKLIMLFTIAVALTIYLTNTAWLLIPLTYSFMSLLPLIDSFIITQTKNDLHFGKLRAWGSIGAACGIFIMGLISSQFPPNIIFILASIMVSICLLILFLSKLSNIHPPKIKYWPNFKILLTNSNFILIIIITALYYGSIISSNAYAYEYSVELVTMSAALFGLVGFVSIISESIFMKWHHAIATRFTIRKLLICIGIISIFKSLTMTIFYDFIGIIVATSLLQGITIGLFIPTIILFIGKIVPEETNATALSLFQSSMHVGGIIIGIIVATLMINLEVNYAYLFYAIITGLSVILMTFLKTKE